MRSKGWGSEEQRKNIRNIGRASQVGIFLVVATIIGWAIGQWLDRIFGTDPWLTALFSLLGIVAGFIELFRVVLSISAEEEEGKDREQ